MGVGRGMCGWGREPELIVAGWSGSWGVGAMCGKMCLLVNDSTASADPSEKLEAWSSVESSAVWERSKNPCWMLRDVGGDGR